MIDIDNLEKLLTYGSPTPWTVYDGGDHWKVTTGPRIVFDDGSACGEYGPECSEADRELIVALANASPALFAELRRLRAIEAAARAYVDLTPDRVDYVPLLFAKLQASVAAKEEA